MSIPAENVENIVDFQQAAHRNVMCGSAVSYSELRLRRPNRTLSTGRNVSFSERERDVPFASTRRPGSVRRRLLRPPLSVEALMAMRAHNPFSLARPRDPPARLPRLDSLLEMGFTRRHITMALRANNGLENMDNLVSWLLEHPLSDAEVRNEFSFYYINSSSTATRNGMLQRKDMHRIRLSNPKNVKLCIFMFLIVERTCACFASVGGNSAL